MRQRPPWPSWGGGTGSLAEITISGDAKFGIDYNSDPTDDDGSPDDNKSKHMFTHEMGVDFTGSGATDGGLTFGGKAGFDTGAEKTNEGTVFISGSFGMITFGANDSADLLAGGIADVGLNGVGVDNVVEDIRGTTANQFRYDQSFGNIALAISAGTSTAEGKPNEFVEGADTYQITQTDSNPYDDDVIEYGSFVTKKNSYAIGMSFSASGATVGFGYDSRKTVSAGLGYSTGQISANALYAKGDKTYWHAGFGGELDSRVAPSGSHRADGTFDAGHSGLGADVSYTMGASTLTLAYAKTDVSNIQPHYSTDSSSWSFSSASFKSLGVGFSHDLGGGAKLVAGFAKVPRFAVGKLGLKEIGQILTDNNNDANFNTDDRPDLSGDRNMASIGLSFSF